MPKKRGFAALLGLLIVLVIGMMLYFMDIRAIFGPSMPSSDRPSQEEDRPWLMEDLLVAENAIVRPPRRGQPELLKPIQLEGKVQRNDAPRGSVKILFGKNCRVEAGWSTVYQDGENIYSLNAQINGNIAADKVYPDPNGSDPSRLYFFAKGIYTQTVQSPDKTSHTEKGVAYMMGWLRPDYTAAGTITITTDQSWSAQYPFTATVQGKP